MTYSHNSKSFLQVTTADYEAMSSAERKVYDAEWRRRLEAQWDNFMNSGKHEDEDLLDSRTYAEHGE